MLFENLTGNKALSMKKPATQMNEWRVEASGARG